MKRRILTSLFVIAGTVAIVAGGTTSFFTDTETSTGNTFVAGAIDLKIDNSSYYNGVATSSLSWALDDLGDPKDPHLFFDYHDLKPGDWGEDTISLHVSNNPAWACMNIKITKNDDATCNEPEQEDDPSCTEPNANLFDGELAQELKFIFWGDDGDNVFETDEEVKLMNVSPQTALELFATSTPQWWRVADSSGNIWNATSTPLDPSVTYHIGKAWCYGELGLDPQTPGANDPTVNPGITCDGEPVSNASQTDQMMVDVSFMAVQSRHNDAFLCNQPTGRELITTTGDEVAPTSGTTWISRNRFGNNRLTGDDELELGYFPAVHMGTDKVWHSGTIYHFTLTYDGVNTATMTVGTTTIPFNAITGANGDIGINAQAPPKGLVIIDNVKLDGNTLTPFDSVTAAGSSSFNDKEFLFITGATQLSDGFTLEGDVSFTWTGISFSANEPKFDIVVEQ
jgi:predicted ribosomally synthesized peptide with SipW-like signal peptide